MKYTLVAGILIFISVSIWAFGVGVNNTFKDKLSHLEMMRQTIEETEEPMLMNGAPQALRMYEREKDGKKELIYAYNLQVAEYNSLANRFPFSIFRESYPTMIEKYYKEKNGESE